MFTASYEGAVQPLGSRIAGRLRLVVDDEAPALEPDAAREVGGAIVAAQVPAKGVE